MKALIYDAPETLSLRDVADPHPAEGEHLVRVSAVGICGSDMHAYLGHDDRRMPPLILGHEAAGVIVGGSRDGDRVTINPLVTCGTCPACTAGRENLCPSRQIISMPPREGAFAQFVSMPEVNLVSVPDAFPMQKAALAEPLAVSWHAARLGLEANGNGIGSNALIIGGGPIGLGAALALRAMGLDEVTIVEPNPVRRSFLSEHCGENVVETADGPFALIVDAVGYAVTRANASALASPGGVIVHVGLAEDTGGLDIRRMTLQEITFIGTYTYTAEDFRQTAQAMYDGKLGDLNWFQSRSLEDGAQAFADLRQGVVAAPKIVLDPWA
ncbi:MAG: alcohol dehydrogenase catalytic domain-containing protein [Litoreibacter sp.]|nr:alcohol dehydrogenase catalytic domain-containing protein [Litoreibacter sp.]